MAQQIILHKESRPTLQEMSDLTQLYTYIEVTCSSKVASKRTDITQPIRSPKKLGLV